MLNGHSLQVLYGLSESVGSLSSSVGSPLSKGCMASLQVVYGLGVHLGADAVLPDVDQVGGVRHGFLHASQLLLKIVNLLF